MQPVSLDFVSSSSRPYIELVSDRVTTKTPILVFFRKVISKNPLVHQSNRAWFRLTRRIEWSYWLAEVAWVLKWRQAQLTPLFPS